MKTYSSIRMNENNRALLKLRQKAFRSSQNFSALFLFVMIPLFLLGCRGAQGPAGKDGASFDTVPPSITMLEPAYGDTLQDTLRVSVRAEDNVGIDEVTFFLDGSDQLTDTTWSYLTQPPFIWTYDLFQMGVEAGFHTVMARAYDIERNHSDTPTMLVYAQPMPPLGLNVLAPGPFDSLALRRLPMRNPLDTLLAADTLLFARFTPERNCRLDSIRVWLDSIPDVVMHYDRPLRIGIHHSNGVFPTDTVVTMLMPTTGLSEFGWCSVRIPQTVTFNRGDRFHVTVSVDSMSATTCMAIGETLVPVYDFATENRSGYYALDTDPPGWVTFQETLDAPELAPELMIEVYVYYLP